MSNFIRLKNVKGFDPIWFGHQKDTPTLFKYLQISSRVYYLALFGYSLYVNWLLVNLGWLSDSSTKMLLNLILFFIPPLLLFYHFAVYKEFWRVAPFNNQTRITKSLYGVWLLFFLLLNIAQIVLVIIPDSTPLFNLLSLAVNYGLLVSAVNIILGIVGEWLLRKLSLMIKLT